MENYNSLDLISFGVDCYEIGMREAIKQINETLNLDVNVTVNKEQMEAKIFNALKKD